MNSFAFCVLVENEQWEREKADGMHQGPGIALDELADESGMDSDAAYMRLLDLGRQLQELGPRPTLSKVTRQLYEGTLFQQEVSRSREQRNFVQNSTGVETFGVVPTAIAETWGGKAAEIRLEEGDAETGLQHIEKNHGKQIRGLGYKNVVEFIDHVLDGYTAVFQGEGRSVFLTVKDESKRWDSVAVKMEYDEAGDFYTVKTATPVRRSFFRDVDGTYKRKLLWEGAPALHQVPKDMTPSAYLADQRSPDTVEGANRQNISTSQDEVKLPGGALYHQQQPLILGATSKHGDGYLVQFFEGANMSTILHETGHVFMLEMEAVVSAGAADAQLWECLFTSTTCPA